MKRIADTFSAEIGLLISCMILFAKWLYFKGTSYSILGFYSIVKKYGGISKFAAATEGTSLPDGAQSIMPAYIFLIMPLAIAFLLLLRAILLLWKRKFKRIEYLSYAAYSIGFIYLLSMGMTAYAPTFLNLAALLLLVPDYIGARFIVEKDEMARKARELKRQEKLALADKKRRMHFPGRYSKDFYQVVYANFKSNFKGYLLFIIAASAFFALLYVLNGAILMLGILNLNKNLLSNKQIVNSLVNVNEIILVISIFLLVLIISNYIRTRMKNYSIFIGLGIRKKTLWLVIALEYLACIIASLVIGLVFGSLFLPLMKLFYVHSMNLSLSSTMPYPLVALITCGIFFFVVGLSTLINYHLFEGTDITASFVKAQKKEKLPRRLLLIGLLFGCYAVLTSMKNYVHGTQMEQLPELFELLFGSLFVLYCGGTMLLKWYMKKEERYLRNLFRIIPWKHRFKTNAKYWFLLFAVQFLVFTVYLPQLSACLIAPPEKELYPYNYVCLAPEGDDAFFGSLKEDFQAELHTYPMVRIHTLLAEPYNFETLRKTTGDGMVFPLGQHIGISESTYTKLKKLAHPSDKKKLHLKGKEIHIVFQQGTAQRARLLDWYDYIIGNVDKSGPHIKAGAAVPYTLNNKDKLYPVYHAKSQEKLILTGMTHGGDSENIVVFSDAYFNRLAKKVSEESKEALTPARLVTIQAPKSEAHDISLSITAHLEKEAADSHLNPADFPCYEKSAALPAAIGERFFKEIGFLVTALILILSSLFIFYLKYSLEIDGLTRKSQLLKSIGMGEPQRRKLLLSEMRAHSLGAYLAAVILSAFSWIAAPFMRLFHAREAVLYYVVFLLIAAAYTFIYALVIHLLEKHFIKIALKN